MIIVLLPAYNEEASLPGLMGKLKNVFATMEESYKVLKMWSNGFSVATEDAPHLRGLVDLYDAGRHLSQALIVASEVGDGEMRYEFKRSTLAADKAPVDFAEDPNAPVGLLPRL